MADDLGVMIEAPEVEETEPVADETSTDALAESTELTPETGSADEPPKEEDPYSTKFTREMRSSLKAWRDSNPGDSQIAKFSRQILANHERLVAFSQMEPKGIDGLREKYALLDGLTHGESRGVDALAAIQGQLQEVEQTDELLAQGDPRAFDALGEAFNDGLTKLAPAYLERIGKTDPEALNRAVMPYIVSTLQQSDLVKHYNDLVDVLNSQNDPRFNDQTKMQFTIQSLARMGQWLNGLQEKAVVPPAGPNKERETFDQERSKFQEEKVTTHWEAKIYPQTRQFVDAKFKELFAPYQSRLKLPPEALDDAKADFRRRLNAAGEADKPYMGQISVYRKQGMANPDAVVNFVRSGLARHVKPVMDSMMKARGYTAFLAGRTKAPVATNGNGKVTQGPTLANVEVRTVKPRDEEIDHQRRTIEQIRTKVFPLKNGKVVQWKPQ